MSEATTHDSRPTEGIFPTFFMTGFESSTFLWKDGQRKDYVTLTGHDRHLQHDYGAVMDLGVGVVRDAIRWPLVDRGNGRYDWSTVLPVIDAANECRISVIWDLCHYGLPDGFDPFDRDAPKRFADYARAAAELMADRREDRHSVRFFTPINEITFFSAGGSDMGWMYPFAKGREQELKHALCRMSIAGVKAIREVDPGGRMVHVDPLIYETAPPDRPDLAAQAREHTFDKALEAWDILAGKRMPELGGAPDVLDIVGVNVYAYSQAQLNADGSRAALGPRDPRRRPLSEMLRVAWERYGRPLIIGETSGAQDGRAEWLRMVMQESLIALNDGVDLQGICLFPCIDMPDWQSGEWARIGMFDLHESEACERHPYEPYLEELRRWQRVLDRPDNVEPDAIGDSLGRVQLGEVRNLARKWEQELGDDERAEMRQRIVDDRRAERAA